MTPQMLLCLDQQLALYQFATTTNNLVTPVVASMNHVLFKHTNWCYQVDAEGNIVMINLYYGNTNVYATYEYDYTDYTMIVVNSEYN